MMNLKQFAESAYHIFEKCIQDYHVINHIHQKPQIPFSEHTLENLFYQKCWVDTVQWHLEDLVRDQHISAEKGMEYKREIDLSNQTRTQLVEKMDDDLFLLLQPKPQNHGITLNSETPAWALDRLSILSLKIFHMKEQTERRDVDEKHLLSCQAKLEILLQQKQDLILAINQLLEDIQKGRRTFKVYKQMKMYNDESLNPILYQKK